MATEINTQLRPFPSELIPEVEDSSPEVQQASSKGQLVDIKKLFVIFAEKYGPDLAADLIVSGARNELDPFSPETFQKLKDMKMVESAIAIGTIIFERAYSVAGGLTEIATPIKKAALLREAGIKRNIQEALSICG